MMISGKIFSWLASAVICLLLLAAGCTLVGEESATLALRFTPQDSTTYKVTTQMEDSVKFEGSLLDDPTFKNRSNSKAIEMTFTQQIQSINNKGNAIAKITIEGLKYLVIQKNKTVQDFDSSREKDKENPLGKLIGQSYTIEISPTGEVIKVIDVKEARAAAGGSRPANKAALKLLSADAIKERHRTLDLPNADKNRLRTGDTWSSIKSFSFGKMGSKSYEKIHTLKEIKDAGHRQLAVIEMNAIPSLAELGQSQEEQPGSILAKMFDNIETYTGQLNLDLTAGKVEKYFEKMRSEWVAVDPEAPKKGDKEPDAVRMIATRLYSLEKIN